jgi:hypothetical protein
MAFELAFSGAAPAGEARIAVAPPETEEAEEPAEAMSAFTGEELRRLGELRAWLAQRRLERGDVIESGRNLAEYPGRQLLTPLGQRFALGFRNRRDGLNRENPVLRIGRGPDGRIRHRYVFGDTEREGAPPESPYSIPAPNGSADSRPPLAKGTGSIESRHRIVRMWTAAPNGPNAAPRLDYEVSEQRR